MIGGRGFAAVVLCAAAPAAAEPEPDSTWIVAANAGVEIAPLAADDTFERLDLQAAWQWRQRWIFGAQLGLAVDHTTTMGLPSGATFRTYLVEAACRLSPSPRLGVVLGWRAGRAGLDFGFAYVHATALEPVAELVVPLADRFELRIEPLAIDLYRSSVWQVTFGPRVGVAWRP